DPIHPVRKFVVLVLFRDDRVPRRARVGRTCGVWLHSLQGPDRETHSGCVEYLANGTDRPLLALCRRRVDLPVPVAVPGVGNSRYVSRWARDRCTSGVWSMSEPHAESAAHTDHAHDDHAHEGHISDTTFMKVFGALLVFTAGSYLTNLI